MKKCPGSKINSKGKGKGLGRGDKKGPLGIPSDKTRKNISNPNRAKRS